LVVKEPIPGAKTNIAPYNHLMLKTILNSTVEDQSWNNSSSNFQVLPHLRGQGKGFSTFE
jgi:hypothetical protein